MKLEQVILNQLITDEEYLRKALPFIRDEYFTDYNERKVFQTIKSFVQQYNSPPSGEALQISLQDDKNLTEDEFSRISEIINKFGTPQLNKQWILDETEQFCKDKAVYNAIVQSIQIIDGKDKNLTNEAIPDILKDALAVSFDNSVGHDYLTDSDGRFDFYHRVEERIPFDLEMFNKITKGGLPNKTLNIALAGTGVGKSLFMCHMAASCMSQGKNVLYITLEMAEERIAERIDANLMNVTMDDLKHLPKQMFDDRISRIRNKTEGKLIIKEYPTASAHSGHFRALLNELSLKKEFRPDIIFIDYLNICASSRFKMTGTVNSYTYIKGIAEELRGLAVEFNVPILSATQTTRSGYGNSDVELTDTSESFGLPATADFMFAIISTEDLEKLGQLLIKQLKNRYNDPSQHKRFVIGVERAKMRLFDLDISAQKNLVQQEVEKPEYNNRPSFVSSKALFGKKNFDVIKF
jgi:replicative DNA helicase